MLIALIGLTFQLVPPGQGAEWAKLITILKNDGRPLETRESALLLACKHATPGEMGQLQSLMSGWIAELDQAGVDSESAVQPLLGAKRDLLAALAQRASSQVNLVAPDNEAALALWTSLATRPWLPGKAKCAAFRAIAENSAPIGVRRTAAISALTDTYLMHSPEAAVIVRPLLDSTCFPALRNLVSQASSPESFNLVAASILAHAGDTEIAAQLEAFRLAWGPEHPRFHRAMTWYLWQIGNQNPPAKLLDAISMAGPLPGPARVWATQRAAELGLPASDTKTAILAYAEALGETQSPNSTRCLACVKAVGLELGILTDTDLPTVTADVAESANEPGAAESAGSLLGPDLSSQNLAWSPTLANMPEFLQWCSTQPWAGQSAVATSQLVKQKLCELNLLPPSTCSDSE